MEKKLYKVTVEYTLLVLAEDDKEAIRIGESNAGEDGSEVETSHAERVSSLKDIPEEWRGALPFGQNITHNKTCQQILEETQATCAADMRKVFHDQLVNSRDMCDQSYLPKH